LKLKDSYFKIKTNSIHTIYNETLDSPLRPFSKQNSDQKYDAIFISELVDYMKQENIPLNQIKEEAGKLL